MKRNRWMASTLSLALALSQFQIGGALAALAASESHVWVDEEGEHNYDSVECTDGGPGVVANAGNGKSVSINIKEGVSADDSESDNYKVNAVIAEASENSSSSVTVGGNASAKSTDPYNGVAAGIESHSDFESLNTVSVTGTVSAESAGPAVGIESMSETGSETKITAGSVSAKSKSIAAGIAANTSYDSQTSVTVNGTISSDGLIAEGVHVDTTYNSNADVHSKGDVTVNGSAIAFGVINGGSGKISPPVALMSAPSVGGMMLLGAEETDEMPAAESTSVVTIDGSLNVNANLIANAIRLFSGYDETDKQNVTVTVGSGITVKSGEGTVASSGSADGDAEVPSYIPIRYMYGGTIDPLAGTSGVSISNTNGDTFNVVVKDGGISSSRQGSSDRPNAFNMANGIYSSNQNGNVSVDVTGDIEADHVGVLLHDTDPSIIVESLYEESEEESTDTQVTSVTNISVKGDVSGSNLYGIANVNSNASSSADVLVDGTVSGGQAGVYIDDATSTDELKLTVWEIKLNENGNAVETMSSDTEGISAATENTQAFEKSIMYIIKVEQPKAGGTLTATGKDGAALSTSHDYDVAKESEEVYLKVDVQSGYKLTGAFNGLGEKVALLQDDKGNYYVVVPKGGGVYLSAELEKLPEEKKEEPRADIVTASSRSENSNPRMGYWKQDAKGWYFQFVGGGYAKNVVLNIDTKSSGGYTPGYYGFGGDGYMLKGWQLINGYWYYFDPANGLMMTGWQNINEKNYYLNPGVATSGGFTVPVGALYVNTTTPDGFKVDASGARI